MFEILTMLLHENLDPLLLPKSAKSSTIIDILGCLTYFFFYFYGCVAFIWTLGNDTLVYSSLLSLKELGNIPLELIELLECYFSD